MKCYEFDDGGGITFYIAHVDEESARTFARDECHEEEVDTYQVKELSVEEMEKMPLHDEDEGLTTMAEYFDRHNKQFPGQAALLSHSEI